MNPPATRRVLLGMLTPSSNTVLEPVTARLLQGVPEVSAHFSRFRVTEIGLGAAASAQFDIAPMLAATDLLADARCQVHCWNGTSAAWLGIDRDRALCAAIEERTGARATSAVLALLEAFRAASVRRYALVTPYLPQVQAAIVATLGAEGYQCVAERHAGRGVNFEFSEVGSDWTLASMRDVSAARPDAIVVLCTNMDAASLAAPLERETGALVIDSIAVASWGALRAAGVDTTRIRGWGRLFEEGR